MKQTTLILVLIFVLASSCQASKANDSDSDMVNEEREETPTELTSAIQGKILCGYQGWFNAEGDGANLGWKHYRNEGNFEPGKCSIDFWPDMSEYDSRDRYKTSFKYSDGRDAYVFSSADARTVNTHFKWMKTYNIDGVFVQRFVSNFHNTTLHDNFDNVFDNCFKASNNNDRLISVMYDLSGSKAIDVVQKTKDDWKQLVDKYKLNETDNPNVLTHDGKAIVSIWGVGFKDRDYTLDNVIELINFFKNDPEYGNCEVLLGVPTGWRTLTRDAVNDPQLHEVIRMADIVHPWTPGRYNNLSRVDIHKQEVTIGDKLWCDQNEMTYMPVVFPGFSWYNLKNGTELSNAIPRLKGDFLWRQYYNNISAGAETIYVAMFDEIDEGTCIFKVDNNPPSGGGSIFLDYEGLPSDYYLWLTGKAGEMLKKEIPLSVVKPEYN